MSAERSSVVQYHTGLKSIDQTAQRMSVVSPQNQKRLSPARTLSNSD